MDLDRAGIVTAMNAWLEQPDRGSCMECRQPYFDRQGDHIIVYLEK